MVIVACFGCGSLLFQGGCGCSGKGCDGVACMLARRFPLLQPFKSDFGLTSMATHKLFPLPPLSLGVVRPLVSRAPLVNTSASVRPHSIPTSIPVGDVRTHHQAGVLRRPCCRRSISLQRRSHLARSFCAPHDGCSWHRSSGTVGKAGVGTQRARFCVHWQ